MKSVITLKKSVLSTLLSFTSSVESPDPKPKSLKKIGKYRLSASFTEAEIRGFVVAMKEVFSHKSMKKLSV
jgi:hypothetical protein